MRILRSCAGLLGIFGAFVTLSSCAKSENSSQAENQGAAANNNSNQQSGLSKFVKSVTNSPHVAKQFLKDQARNFVELPSTCEPLPTSGPMPNPAWIPKGIHIGGQSYTDSIDYVVKNSALIRKVAEAYFPSDTFYSAALVPNEKSFCRDKVGLNSISYAMIKEMGLPSERRRLIDTPYAYTVQVYTTQKIKQNAFRDICNTIEAACLSWNPSIGFAAAKADRVTAKLIETILDLGIKANLRNGVMQDRGYVSPKTLANLAVSWDADLSLHLFGATMKQFSKPLKCWQDYIRANPSKGRYGAKFKELNVAAVFHDMFWKSSIGYTKACPLNAGNLMDDAASEDPAPH